ncbi:MAG: TlpA family protein disulfide reductase [Alphaproteobacteria bacterium]|nr:TlpA family protein disulfide reductase [Alphaproteobacteria bacterium]
MRIKLFSGLAILLLALSALLYDRFATPDAPPAPASRAPEPHVPPAAPAFRVAGLEAGEVSLADLSEPVVLLNFWASWCMPCLTELPSMLTLVEESGGRVALLAVSTDSRREDAQRIVAMLQEKYSAGKTPPHVYWAWDGSQRLSAGVFNTVKVPETILLDRDRRMVSKVVGGADWSKGELREAVDALAREP